MRSALAAVAIALLGSVAATTKLPYVRRYKQCGGLEWTGGTECTPDFICVKDNDYFSSCKPKTYLPQDPMSECAEEYEPCGGKCYLYVQIML
jgi:Fungal cellulose binding domain